MALDLLTASERGGLTLAQFGVLPEWEQEVRIAKVIHERQKLEKLRDDFLNKKNEKGERFAWTPVPVAIIRGLLDPRVGKIG